MRAERLPPGSGPVDAERAAYWLGVGAQPTEAVTAILRATGDWQRYKGESAPPPLRVAPAKPDKRERFNAALAEMSGEPEVEATTPRKRAAKKVAEPAASSAAADSGSGGSGQGDTASSDSASGDSASGNAGAS